MDSAKITANTSSVASNCLRDAVESRIRVARVVIKFIVLAVWVLYLMIWVVSPTKVYANSWWPVIMEKTNTVYFGIQGMAILIYTVPVLLMAVLGCVYLYLGERLNLSGLQQIIKDRRNVNKKVVSWWRRLCLVKGPLGIVSRTEVIFLAMFIILLVFSFLSYIHRGLDWITSVKPDDMKRSLVVLESVALWAGLVGNICLAFMFFPVTRGSSILPLLGLSYESSIRYHIWLGHIAMVLFTAHGSLYVLFWALTSDLTQMLRWDEHGVSNVAGEVSLTAGVVMWLTTFPKIRENMFELFFYTHHLYIIFMVFFMLHIGLYCTCMMLPGFYLFVLDRYLRLLQSQQHVKLISARVLSCGFVELNFAKSPGLKYPPASSMFVNVPSVSRLQWHPFTVCSSSDLETDSISVLIKSEGSWSRKLHQILSAHPSVEHLPVSIEGPYGPASTHFLKYETLVMVSGGSGITPFISIIRGLVQFSSNKASKPQRVILVSAFKCSADLTVLDLLLPLSASSSSSSALLSNLDIRIEAYVTREQEPSNSSRDISTVWLKAKNSDAPISPTLGPNSWLWLAMIISASFAISLVLIAFATHYFIYPVDKNTDRIYSRSLKTIIYILSFCVSIVVSASVAFMWNKAKGGNPMDSNMVPLVDLELENLPRKTLDQVTNVHYGARPDLRKILSECRGSSIGVHVCGPKEMQSVMASICSSSSLDNVHFEFINFSW